MSARRRLPNRRLNIAYEFEFEGHRYHATAGRYILIVRADGNEPLVVLPLKLAAEIAAKAGGL
jgi:hypothetical protein